MLSKQIFPFYKWKYMAGARAGAGEKIMKKIVAGAGAEIWLFRLYNISLEYIYLFVWLSL